MYCDGLCTTRGHRACDRLDRATGPVALVVHGMRRDRPLSYPAHPCASPSFARLCAAHPCAAHLCAGEPHAGSCGCARHKKAPGRVGGVEARRCAALARRPRRVGIVRGRPRPHGGYLFRVRLSQQRVSPRAARAHLSRPAPGTSWEEWRTHARDESRRACAKEGAVRRCGGRSAARADARRGETMLRKCWAL